MLNKATLERIQLALRNKNYKIVASGFFCFVFRLLGFLISLPTITILWILKPFFWIKVGFLQYGRIGHLALNTDLFLRRRQLGIYPDGPFYCLSYPVLKGNYVPNLPAVEPITKAA